MPSYELVSIAGAGGTTVEISVTGHHWTQHDTWEPDTSESGMLSISVDLQGSDSPVVIPQPQALPTTHLHMQLRELRYRLAQLPAYDREQCAKEIEAPMRDVMAAAAHAQVEVIMHWAEQNGKVEELKGAVANRSGQSEVEAAETADA